MQRNRRWRLVRLTFLVLTIASVAAAEPRTWSNNSGEFKITADLVAIQNGNVVLRTDDGRQLTVPVKQLSVADREFVAGLESPGKSPRRGAGKGAELIEIAKNFFNELRSEKREVAGVMLTTKAKDVLAAGKSPLANLPAPEEGDRALRVGRPKIDRDTAEIPVQVKSADKLHKVKLHLRKEEDEQWRVFAMSAIYPEGERLVNLESELTAEGSSASLAALVGKPFQFSGMTLDGKPLDLRRYQGKTVLVAFWMAQDRAEMASVFASYQKHFQEGFDVISVSLDNDLMMLAENLNRQPPPWAVVADKYPGNPQPLAQKYQISQSPTLILVGRDGNVASVECSGKKLEEVLAKVLPAKPAQGEPTGDKPTNAIKTNMPAR